MSGAGGRSVIDQQLAAALVAECFPAWAHLAVRQVLPGGHDNRTFRLGEELAIRLPSAAAYVPAVEKEQRWLPVLAARLPLPIPVPVPVAAGRPSAGYPWPWSVNRWLAGSTLDAASGVDARRLAEDLARFLRSLRDVEVGDAPEAGRHSFFRGGDLAVYEDEARAAIALLGSTAQADRATGVLDRALSTRWMRSPVWVHGDVAAGNLLVDDDGRLSAVLDFGACAVGDPACDLVLAWTWFDAGAAAVFRSATDLDDDTWARAAGWALWKALITLDEPRGGAARTLERLQEDDAASP